MALNELALIRNFKHYLVRRGGDSGWVSQIPNVVARVGWRIDNGLETVLGLNVHAASLAGQTLKVDRGVVVLSCVQFEKTVLVGRHCVLGTSRYV